MTEPLEGAGARMARVSRENMKKILDKADDTHQIIIICTELNGKEPTHVHIQGPSKDKILLYGMLGVARDVVGLANQTKIESQDQG